jgi:ankyrin repeat protein
VRALARVGLPISLGIPGTDITPLHSAAMLVAREPVVAALLEGGADVRAVGSAGQTALHGAALLGNLETVKLLLQAGADPALADSAGNTPLHLAAQLGNGDVLAVLIEAGGPPVLGQRDGQGRTALDILRARHDERTVASLLDRVPSLKL